MFNYTNPNNPVLQVRNEAKNLGLLRDTDSHAISQKVKAVYLSFAQFVIPNLGTDLYLPKDTELDCNNSVIVGLEIIDTTTNVVFPNPPVKDATDGITEAQLKQFMFVAQDELRTELFSLPLYTMVKRLNSGKTCQVLMNKQIWGNCFIRCVDTTGLAATNGIWMNVFYNPK